jgi:hypothetical protein
VSLPIKVAVLGGIHGECVKSVQEDYSMLQGIPYDINSDYNSDYGGGNGFVCFSPPSHFLLGFFCGWMLFNF